MAEQDLHRFLNKVLQLQQMVESLKHQPERREQLAACDHHNQVVKLAQSWGYEIGRRWGDVGPVQELGSENNLLAQPMPSAGNESKLLLHSGDAWHLELILSCSASSPEGFWYDQVEHEWILLLRGSASLRLKDRDASIQLNVGDHLHLAPHQLHRVEQTDSYPGTIWLALFWHESQATDQASQR